MRLKADIEVSNRSLAVHNMSASKGKAAHGSLTIGRKPKGLKQSTLKENSLNNGEKQDPDIFLMVSTAQNLAGTKYALTSYRKQGSIVNCFSNVEKVFERFVDEGKATIRFREPTHDLCLKKADPVQLKAFISLVKKILQLSSSKANDEEL